MKSVLFFSSGGGGNLKFIHSFASKYNLKLLGTIADRPCPALEYCESKNLIHKIKNFDRSLHSNNELITILTSISPDIIVTNIHKIIAPKVLDSLDSKIINLHYSYLPAYKGMIGMKPIEEAHKRKNLFAGTTCHFVTNEIDNGETLSQGLFPLHIEKENNFQTTFEAGALTLLSGLLKISGNNKDSNNSLLYKDIIVRPGIENYDLQEFEVVFDTLSKK